MERGKFENNFTSTEDNSRTIFLQMGGLSEKNDVVSEDFMDGRVCTTYQKLICGGMNCKHFNV